MNKALILEIYPTEIAILVSNEPYIEVVKWVEDEWQEDPDLMASILNALNMAITDPVSLLQLNKKHLESQGYDISTWSSVTTEDTLFLVRDEIIDARDDIEDYWEGELMKESVMDRLSNALSLLEDIRQDLGIADRDYVPDS